MHKVTARVGQELTEMYSHDTLSEVPFWISLCMHTDYSPSPRLYYSHWPARENFPMAVIMLCLRNALSGPGLYL